MLTPFQEVLRLHALHRPDQRDDAASDRLHDLWPKLNDVDAEAANAFCCLLNHAESGHDPKFPPGHFIRGAIHHLQAAEAARQEHSPEARKGE